MPASFNISPRFSQKIDTQIQIHNHTHQARMSSTYIKKVIDCVLTEIDNRFEELSSINVYDEDFESFLDWFIEKETNTTEYHFNTYTREYSFIENEFMNNYHNIIEFVNQAHLDMLGEDIGINVVLNPRKLKMNLLYFVGRIWKNEKQEDYVWKDNKWCRFDEFIENMIEDNSLSDEGNREMNP